MEILLEGLGQTLIMVLVSTFIAFAIGIPLGIILVLSQKDGLKERPSLYRILSSIINILRSVPFIILMIILFPLSRKIVGTSIGTKAAIIPLAVSAAPFVARLIEENLNNVDKGKIDASISMGASLGQTVRMMLKEALPQIIATISNTTVNIIGYSAMAGSIGGGGLGDIAIRYGLYRGENKMLLAAVVTLVALVQIIHLIGLVLARKLNKK